MSENTQLDIDTIGIGVDCVGIDHGCYPIEDAPVYNGKSGNGSTPQKDRINTFVPVDNNTPAYTAERPPKKPKARENRFFVFCGKTSFTLGIIGIIGSFVPFVQVFTVLASIVGFFLSLFGKKARSVRAKNICGRIFNIVAVALTILMFAFYMTELGLYQ